MSSLSQFFGGSTKSLQTGYVSTTSSSAGSGEDASYIDVSVSSVDTSKCLLLFDGGAAVTNAQNASFKSGSTASYLVIPKMTSGTNLRLSTPAASQSHFAGRWQIVEFQ